MKVWKVVRKDSRGRYVSMIANYPAKAVYEIGEETLPPIDGSMLMAFAKKSEAILFARIHGAPLRKGSPDALLMAGEARMVFRSPVVASDSYAAGIRKFWKSMVGRAAGRAPSNTLFITSFTPTGVFQLYSRDLDDQPERLGRYRKFPLVPLHCWTDYPFRELGDTPGEKAPVRRCKIVGYDGDKYADIIVGGKRLSVKSGYLYVDKEKQERNHTVSRNALYAIGRVVKGSIGAYVTWEED